MVFDKGGEDREIFLEWGLISPICLKANESAEPHMLILKEIVSLNFLQCSRNTWRSSKIIFDCSIQQFPLVAQSPASLVLL